MKIGKLLDKAKQIASDVDFKNLDNEAKKVKKVVRDKMKEHKIDEKIEKTKEETIKLSDKATNIAQKVYENNKDVLEKPVKAISDIVDKASEHETEIKWVGGIAISIVAPVTTLIAATTLYLISNDEEASDEVIEKAKKIEDDIKNGVVIKKESEWVTLYLNTKERTVEGVIIKGEQRGQTFEDIGLENMKVLSENAPDPETQKYVSIWIKSKESQ